MRTKLEELAVEVDGAAGGDNIVIGDSGGKLDALGVSSVGGVLEVVGGVPELVGGVGLPGVVKW